MVWVEKGKVFGEPDADFISTSYVERQNLQMRMHMRRLTRLTNAFSKKFENFRAAVGLHFAYYNFVLRDGTLRMTPAMAAGIEKDFWTVEQLVEATCMKPGHIDALQETIREQFACESSLVSVEPFREIHDGNVVWDGDMVLFHVIGDPTASECYAWANEKDGKWHCTAVLRTPKTDTSRKAFWAFILAHHV